MYAISAQRDNQILNETNDYSATNHGSSLLVITVRYIVPTMKAMSRALSVQGVSITKAMPHMQPL